MQASPEEPGAKKRRTFFGKHAKCGHCHTCLHPGLKRACMVNRPPEVAAAANVSRNKSNASGKALTSGGPYSAAAVGGGGITGFASATEFLAAQVDWPDDKPVPAHGVSGFKLPIEPKTRAKKWTRTCASAPAWPGVVDPRPDGIPPEERAAPWPDTTTRAQSRVAALLSGDAAAGDGGASPQGGHKATPHAVLSPGGPASAAPPPKEPPAPPPPGWHVCTHPGCSKAYELLPQLKRHAQTHREKTNLCPFPGCGKAFLDASKLGRHQAVHAQDRDLVCRHPGCGRVFTMPTHLATHSKTHQTDSMVCCPYPGCDKKYALAFKIKAHIAKHEKEGDGPPPSGEATPGSAAAPGKAAEEEQGDDDDDA